MQDLKALKSYVCIFAREIMVETRIGLLPRERQASQRLRVSVELYADPLIYLKKVSERSIIDYDDIYRAVQDWRHNDHTPLLETCVQELIALAFSDKRVVAARLSVSKPDVYDHADAAGVEAFLTRKDFRKLRLKRPKTRKTIGRGKVRQAPAIESSLV